MPFTLAHSAAALPFRRLRLVPSALVIGTFAPDFEYFLRMDVVGRVGHTMHGVFLFALPVAMGMLWLFQRFVKGPATLLLPDGVQRRLAIDAEPFRFFGLARFLWIIFSILLGIATHLVWDSFTHKNTWPTRHWPLLRIHVQLPMNRQLPIYGILQHGSSVLGLFVLLLWFWSWYRSTEPMALQPVRVRSSAQKFRVIAVTAALALLGTFVRVVVFGLGWPGRHAGIAEFIGQSVVTLIALLWWELVVYGIFATRSIEPEYSGSK
jgi:hypothetical protein